MSGRSERQPDLPAGRDRLGRSDRRDELDLDLAGCARVRFTTRTDGDLGLTEPGEADQAVLGNRAGVLERCRLVSVAAGHQVHGARVRLVREAGPGYVVSSEPADGLATRLAGVGVAIHAADCLPIAIAGDGGVAIVHGGWRGLAGGVVAAGVAALRELGVSGPLDAAIGPGVGGCCYETGEEVRDAFGGRDAPGRGRCLDLKEIARRQLVAAGARRVDDVEVCTLCADPGLVFSYRRDGPDMGRHAGIAWLE